MAALRVIEIFDSLQGEGHWTGVPMTFVRLAGCNAPALDLGCVRWCDTPGSWDVGAGEELDVAEIASRVRLPRLCLTGGEPLLQLDGVAALVLEAHRREIRVHVETNGTIGPPRTATAVAAAVTGRAGAVGFVDASDCAGAGPDVDAGFDWVVVSPKPPEYSIAPEWAGLVDELKLVADEYLEAATAERLAAAHPGAFVSIQPVWQPELQAAPASVAAGPSSSPAARESVERAVSLVMSHPEWRVSPQMHKHLGLR